MSFNAAGVQTANATFSITAAASVTDGVDFTATGHGMAIGDPVLHTGFTTNTDYNGVWIVTGVPDTNSYVIRDQGLEFGTSESGTGEPGDTLSDATGVTGLSLSTNEQGGSRYENQHRVYVATSAVNLQLGGLLYIDPEVDTLVFQDNGTNTDQQIDITDGGILRVGRPIVFNGATRYSYGMAIVSLPDSKNRFQDTQGWLEIQDGGLFEWRGGVLKSMSGVIRVNPGGNFNPVSTEHCVWITANCDQENTTQNENMGQIRQGSLDSVIQGYTRAGGLSANATASEVVSLNSSASEFSGYRPIHINIGVGDSNTTVGDPSFEGYQGQGITTDFSKAGPQDVTLLNNENGTDVTFVHINDNAAGEIAITHEFTLNVFDSASVEVSSDLLWFYRDTDNGNRFAPHLADLTYSGGSGDTVEFSLLFLDGDDDSLGDSVPYPDSAIDRRLEDDDTSDVATIPIWSYSHLFTTVSAVMKGAAGATQNTTVFTDTNITETTRATVDAYSTITTGERLYDRSKSEKISLTAAIIEFPDLNTALITGSGNNLDLGDISLTVDGGAASAWALSQTGNGRITIDAGTDFNPTGKFNTITTTGDVTVEDGTEIDGWTIDGDLLLNNANNLSNVTVTGDLRIATGADSVLTFNNVNVTGSVFNDSGSNTLTINNNGGSLTAGDAGTGNGETNILTTNTFTITGVPSGGILSIFAEDDIPDDFQELGTLLQETDPTTGADVLYVHEETNDLIAVQYIQTGFEEVNVQFTLLAQAQTLDISSLIAPEENL